MTAIHLRRDISYTIAYCVLRIAYCVLRIAYKADQLGLKPQAKRRTSWD